MEKIKMSLLEWQAEGEKRFGKNRLKWKFVCPVCKTVIAVQEYKDLGADEGAVAFSCVGRYLPREQTQEAFLSNKITKGKPCSYSGGGLFKLNPVQVGDNPEVTFFEFAKNE